MAEEETKSNHDCTRLQLYTIVQMVITNGLANMAALHTFKAKYITAFFTTMSTNLAAAIATPGQEAITFEHVIVRIDLVEYAAICCRNFQNLKAYIKDAFPANQQKAMLALAGGNLYRAASQNNWESVAGMNVLMIAFVANTGRLTALLAGGNMPTTFPTKINSDSVNFNDENGTFNTARQTGTATSAKNTADNLCYTQTINVCDDAQQALVGFPDLQNLFIFDRLKNQIAPPGSASYKVTAEIAVTFLKVVGIVTIQQAGQPSISIPLIDGIALFENINPAKYTVIITGESVITLEYHKEIDTGTNAHTEAILETSVIMESDDHTDETPKDTKAEAPKAPAPAKEVAPPKDTKKPNS